MSTSGEDGTAFGWSAVTVDANACDLVVCDTGDRWRCPRPPLAADVAAIAGSRDHGSAALPVRQGFRRERGPTPLQTQFFHRPAGRRRRQRDACLANQLCARPSFSDCEREAPGPVRGVRAPPARRGLVQQSGLARRAERPRGPVAAGVGVAPQPPWRAPHLCRRLRGRQAPQCQG